MKGSTKCSLATGFQADRRATVLSVVRQRNTYRRAKKWLERKRKKDNPKTASTPTPSEYPHGEETILSSRKRRTDTYERANKAKMGHSRQSIPTSGQSARTASKNHTSKSKRERERGGGQIRKERVGSEEENIKMWTKPERQTDGNSVGAGQT